MGEMLWIEQEVQGKSGSLRTLRGQCVKAFQCCSPHGLIDIVAAVEQQVAAVGDGELGMALEGNHLMTYPERLVLAEVAGGAAHGIGRQGHDLVVVAVEQVHLAVGEIGFHLFVYYV